jgi:hypothetical protein
MYRMTLTLVNLTGNDLVCNADHGIEPNHEANDNPFAKTNQRLRDSDELRTRSSVGDRILPAEW